MRSNVERKGRCKNTLHENKALAKTDKLSGVSLTRLFFMSIGMKDIHDYKGFFMDNPVEHGGSSPFKCCGETK